MIKPIFQLKLGPPIHTDAENLTSRIHARRLRSPHLSSHQLRKFGIIRLRADVLKSLANGKIREAWKFQLVNGGQGKPLSKLGAIFERPCAP